MMVYPSEWARAGDSYMPDIEMANNLFLQLQVEFLVLVQSYGIGRSV